MRSHRHAATAQIVGVRLVARRTRKSQLRGGRGREAFGKGFEVASNLTIFEDFVAFASIKWLSSCLMMLGILSTIVQNFAPSVLRAGLVSCAISRLV